MLLEVWFKGFDHHTTLSKLGGETRLLTANNSFKYTYNFVIILNSFIFTKHNVTYRHLNTENQCKKNTITLKHKKKNCSNRKSQYSTMQNFT